MSHFPLSFITLPVKYLYLLQFDVFNFFLSRTVGCSFCFCLIILVSSSFPLIYRREVLASVLPLSEINVIWESSSFYNYIWLQIKQKYIFFLFQIAIRMAFLVYLFFWSVCPSAEWWSCRYRMANPELTDSILAGLLFKEYNCPSSIDFVCRNSLFVFLTLESTANNILFSLK